MAQEEKNQRCSHPHDATAYATPVTTAKSTILWSKPPSSDECLDPGIKDPQAEESFQLWHLPKVEGTHIGWALKVQAEAWILAFGIQACPTVVSSKESRRMAQAWVKEKGTRWHPDRRLQQAPLREHGRSQVRRRQRQATCLRTVKKGGESPYGGEEKRQKQHAWGHVRRPERSRPLWPA